MREGGEDKREDRGSEVIRGSLGRGYQKVGGGVSLP